jgi:CBS domain-containing protein
MEIIVKIRDVVELKGSKIVTVSPNFTLAETVGLMTGKHVGSAIVTDEGGQLMGVITERDVLRFCSDPECSLTKTHVRSLMTTDPIVALPDDDVGVMIATMVENRFRHLPVMADGKLTALVSMGDLVKSQLKEVKVENRHLKDYIAGKYPA